MFCHLCGSKIQEDDFFCRNCGEASVPILAELDKRHLSIAIGAFLLGAAGFFLVVFSLITILFALLPLMKGPQTAIFILFAAGMIVSGIGVAAFREFRITKRKLQEERDKRRASLSNAVHPGLSVGQFADFPGSVTESTTVKLVGR